MIQFLVAGLLSTFLFEIAQSKEAMHFDDRSYHDFYFKDEKEEEYHKLVCRRYSKSVVCAHMTIVSSGNEKMLYLKAAEDVSNGRRAPKEVREAFCDYVKTFPEPEIRDDHRVELEMMNKVCQTKTSSDLASAIKDYVALKSIGTCRLFVGSSGTIELKVSSKQTYKYTTVSDKCETTITVSWEDEVGASMRRCNTDLKSISEIRIPVRCEEFRIN